MAKTFNIQYLVLPDFVFNNEKLSLISMKVYAFIHNYRMPEFFYGNERLAELFDCSESSITKAISQLKAEGYITTTFDGRKRFIEDLYVTHRVVKFSDSESEGITMEPQAGESEGITTLNQASTAGANKNNLIKKSMENLVDEEEYADKGWLEAKRNRKENKGRGVFQGRGFPPKPGSTPRYEKKERTGVHAEDVV